MLSAGAEEPRDELLGSVKFGLAIEQSRRARSKHENHLRRLIIERRNPVSGCSIPLSKTRKSPRDVKTRVRISRGSL